MKSLNHNKRPKKRVILQNNTNTMYSREQKFVHIPRFFFFAFRYENMNRTTVERQHPAKRYAELGIGSFPLNDGESAESLTVRTRATKINSL